jgi:hypothetical protein
MDGAGGDRDAEKGTLVEYEAHTALTIVYRRNFLMHLYEGSYSPHTQIRGW